METAQSFLAGHKEPSPTPRIVDAINEYQAEYDAACRRTFVNGERKGYLHQFIKIDKLPLFYQIHAYIVLAAEGEDGEPWDSLAAMKHWLGKDQDALDAAKKLYVHEAYDAVALKACQGQLDELWSRLHKLRNMIRLLQLEVLYRPLGSTSDVS